MDRYTYGCILSVTYLVVVRCAVDQELTTHTPPLRPLPPMPPQPESKGEVGRGSGRLHKHSLLLNKHG